MAESNALPSILDHGLLSTSSLLDLFEVNGLVRIRLERRVRRQSEKITHAQYGSAVIRDQKPIVNETRLAKCLQGATPEEWLRLLNSKVFFWLDRARLDRLRSARAYRQQKHLILTLNTRKVVDDYSAQITLCAMNSGNCLPYPHNRSPASFSSIENFDYDMWRRKRGRREIIVECAVDSGIRDVRKYLLSHAVV